MFFVMNSKASSMDPPSQPWSLLVLSQSTISCSDSEISLLVESLLMPSVAAIAENAQQLPVVLGQEDREEKDCKLTGICTFKKRYT